MSSEEHFASEPHQTDEQIAIEQERVDEERETSFQFQRETRDDDTESLTSVPPTAQLEAATTEPTPAGKETETTEPAEAAAAVEEARGRVEHRPPQPQNLNNLPSDHASPWPQNPLTPTCD